MVTWYLFDKCVEMNQCAKHSLFKKWCWKLSAENSLSFSHSVIHIEMHCQEMNQHLTMNYLGWDVGWLLNTLWYFLNCVPWLCVSFISAFMKNAFKNILILHGGEEK